MSSILFTGLTTIVLAGIFYERKIYLLPFIYYSLAVIKVTINLATIPYYGIMAAAMATLASSIILPYLAYSISKKYFSFEIEWSRLIKFSLAISIPIVYSIYFAASIKSPLDWFLTVILTCISIFIFFRYCIILEEKEFIIRILKNKSKVNFI